MKIIDFEVMDDAIRFYLGKDELEKWWGDDWNDKPYEHNAGTVYSEFVAGTKDISVNSHDIIVEPCDGCLNSPYSKDDFRDRKVPCLVIIKRKDYPEHFYEFSTYQDIIRLEKVTKIYFGDNIDEVIEKIKN